MSSSVFSMTALSLVLIGCVTYIVALCLTKLSRFRRRVIHINKLPGADDTHWLFGDIKDFPGPTEEGLTWLKVKSAQIQDGVARVWYSPFHYGVVLNQVNSIKTLLKTSEPKPRGIGGYFMLDPWLGDGLLLSVGSKWARNRRLLTPAFHFDILRPYMDINNRCTDVFLGKLEQFSDRGESFEVTNHISQLTLDVILRCAFSYNNDCQLRGETHPYVSAVNSLGEIVTYRFTHPYLYPDFIFNMTSRGRKFKRNCQYVHQVSDEIIQKRKQELLKEGEVLLSKKGRYLDFLDVLLTAKDDDGQMLSDQEIRDEVDTFLFEGHDTTASGIMWTLYSLASNSEHQQRCQQEIDGILESRENQDIEWEDLSKLKYLTMCLRESLRIHTPVPFIQRETTQDMTIEGYFIPAGSLLDIHIYLLHHNAAIWDDPEKFKPERFSDENKEQSNFAFVPFSGGPRNCIGQNFAMHEMKTVIARILSRFTLSLDAEHEVKHKITVVMKTENGMYMKASPRRRHC